MNPTAVRSVAVLQTIESHLWSCDIYIRGEQFSQAYAAAGAAWKLFNANRQQFTGAYGESLKQKILGKLLFYEVGMEGLSSADSLCRAARIICERESGGSDGKT